MEGQPLETEYYIRYCSSLSWFREVFDMEIAFEYNLNECSFGLLGAASQSGMISSPFSAPNDKQTMY